MISHPPEQKKSPYLKNRLHPVSLPGFMTHSQSPGKIFDKLKN
jgi:hypothetical protein